ncbi:hypothetical protein PR048_017379 [Dryococelus australis]|uniref:Uncharacterized protein n=1 Tax=Dryococelus australis TaxID=614101 RepID=A0ABQ9H9C5_9NEOP|nr:hypothetical protein PR048_017379 [Dryococelus australis]
MSCMVHDKPTFKKGAFHQFVFDNADLNICTIDGLNTFHSMDGIRCVTPARAIERDVLIIETGNLGIIPLETFQGKGDGLNNVIVEHLELPEESAHPPPHNIPWLLAQKQCIPVPQWKGYMHTVTRGEYIITLPFINAPPSNYDTVYTALTYAAELCEKINQQCVIITFDQPPYWKGREVVAGTPSDSYLSLWCILVGFTSSCPIWDVLAT